MHNLDVCMCNVAASTRVGGNSKNHLHTCIHIEMTSLTNTQNTDKYGQHTHNTESRCNSSLLCYICACMHVLLSHVKPEVNCIHVAVQGGSIFVGG